MEWLFDQDTQHVVTDSNERTADDFATQTALQALTHVAELGELLRFMRESHACIDSNALAECALLTVKNYDLTALLMLRPEGCPQSCYALTQEITPNEVSLLDNAAATPQRIFETAHYCVFNYRYCSLIITNWSDQEVLRAGRLRDHLAQLCEGIDARLDAMLSSIPLPNIVQLTYQPLISHFLVQEH